MWIDHRKPEITKFIQDQIDQYALEKLDNNHLIPEAIERLNELRIMEMYQPQPTIYHTNHETDKDEYEIWPKDDPKPPLKWKDPTPWLEDKTPTPSPQNLDIQQQIIDTLSRQNNENRQKYERFKHNLRKKLQD